MDGNKDEALRCRRIAEEAIASGNKLRALKFIGLAQRLNHNLPIHDLLAVCQNLASDTPTSSTKVNNHVGNDTTKINGPAISDNQGLNYSQEHVQLIRQIKRNNDYYVILGVEKTCSVEDIRKAYRKLSLKVHPDKNKAPGSEDAFKKVCKAFKCLSDDDSRKQYDHTGLVDEFEYNQQHNVRRRRRRSGHDLFDDDFDPDEIFRSFFGQADMFRTSHVYTTRGMGGAQQRPNLHDGGPNLMLLLQILPFLLIFLLAYLPFSEPEYSLQQTYSYQFLRKTEKHKVDFYVKTAEFDQNYPLGSPDRDKIEDHVIKDYKNLLGHYCHIELQRRQWSRNLPTPHCDRLRNLGVA